MSDAGGAARVSFFVSFEMRKRVVISIVAMLVLALAYEVAFRCVAASCGEVDVKAIQRRVFDSLSTPGRSP